MRQERFCLPNGDQVVPVITIADGIDTPVSLYQHPKTRLFYVQYGKSWHNELRYNEACKMLGAALMHSLCCAYKMDNEGP